MRDFINILTEAPIEDWTIDPDFNSNEKEMISKFHGYEQEQKHWSDIDKFALRDPATIQKIKTAFLRVPVKINLYFWQSTNPNYDITLEKGAVDIEWVRNKLGEHAYEYVNKTSSPDSITIIMTNNLSDEHKINFSSPWLVAHRISHALFGVGNRKDWKLSRYLEDFVYKILKHGYGVQWPDESFGSWWYTVYEDYREIYTKMMGHYIGTMHSARSGKLVQASEWKHETISQYLMTGAIKIKPLPDHFDEGLDLTKDPKKRQLVMKMWANFPKRMAKLIDNELEASKGQIWVM